MKKRPSPEEVKLKAQMPPSEENATEKRLRKCRAK
jgi:hypothetical protein